jgi:hypothetical protein
MATSALNKIPNNIEIKKSIAQGKYAMEPQEQI